MVTPCIRYLGAQKHIPGHLWPFLLIAALTACSTLPKGGVAAPPDEVLQQAVEVALAADDEISAGAITVRVTSGTVELSGLLSSVAEVRRALRRAGTVDGVRAIVNRLRVGGP